MTNPVTAKSSYGKVRSSLGYTGTQLTVSIGVTFQKVSNPSNGLTWDDYQRGLKIWRGNQRIRRHMLGEGLDPLPNRKLIGYVGTDYDTGQRYMLGMRRLKSDRPSRWGWGMYVADNPMV